MRLGEYLLGLGILGVTFGSAGLSATVLVRRRFAYLDRVDAVLAGCVLFTVALFAIHVVPLMLGVLARGTAVAAAVVLAATVPLLVRSVPAERAAGPQAPPSGGAAWVLATGATLAAGLVVAAFLRDHASQPTAHVDALSFQLPLVAHWLQTGSLWHNDEFLPFFVTGTYPSNGNVLFAAVMLPWRADAFLRFAGAGYLAIAGLGTFALARQLRAPVATAVLAAAALVSVRTVAKPAIEQVGPDVVLLAMYAAGAAFLVRHAYSGRAGDLVLAGLALGLAFGSKWYGISTVVALLVAWVAVGWLAGRRRDLLRHGAALAGLVLAAGGVWFIRNWVTTGDPLYPIKVAPFGLTIFAAPVDRNLEAFGSSLLDRVGQADAWRDVILPELWSALGLAGAVLGIVTLAALVLAARAWRRAGADRRGPAAAAWAAPAMVALAALLVVAAYAITPASAQGFPDRPFEGFVAGNARWVAPALTLAAPLAAWIAGRLGRARIVLECVLAAAVLDGLARAFDLSLGRVAAFGVKAGAALAALAIAWLLLRRVPPGAPRLAGTIAAAGLLAIGVAAGGYHLQRDFLADRYAGLDPTIDYVLQRTGDGARIGVTGGWRAAEGVPSPTYPAFGPRFENKVDYVGRLDVATKVPYTRPERFRAALARFDMVIIGDVRHPLEPHTNELAWARAGGWRVAARSDRFTLLLPPPGSAVLTKTR